MSSDLAVIEGGLSRVLSLIAVLTEKRSHRWPERQQQRREYDGQNS